MSRFLYTVIIAVAFAVSAVAQSQPGTVRFPSNLDDADSLFGRLTDQPLTTLNGTITGSATTITVFSTAAFGSSGSLVIGSEIIYYTGKTSTTFTGCVRGRDGTAATTHASGSLVRSPVLSVHHRKQSEAIIAVETKIGAGASDASAASTGWALIKQADGTTKWSAQSGAQGAAGPPGPLGDSSVSIATCAGTDDTTAIQTAITQAAGGTVLILSGQTCAASSSITFPASGVLKVMKGGLLKPITGQTVTIQSYIDAGPYQIFTNALASQGTVSITSRAVQEVYPEWWGASPSASAATNTPALQAAIIGAYGSNRTNASGLAIYNRILKFSGMYDVNDKLDVFHMNGFIWQGQNKFNSGLNQTATNKQIINGQSISYGVFWNLKFTTSASQNTALVDLDYDGSQGDDLRPQNITFHDCFFAGNSVGYIGARIAKSGTGSQGDNVRFSHCYISGFTQAGAQLGGGADGTPTALAQNAINVKFENGDIQGCPKYGLASYGGNWIVENVTFENGLAVQTGADVLCYGPQRPCTMNGIISESLRQAAGVSVLQNVFVQHAANVWTQAQQAGLAVTNILTGTPYGGDGKYYQVTVGGTFGGLSTTTATGGSSTTVVKTSAGWTASAFVGYRATIMSGPGKYQYCVITSNTSDTITCSAGWVTDFQNITIANPTSSSTFVVEPNWGTQFSSGGVTWTLLDFYSIDGVAGSVISLKLTNVSSGGGRINLNVDFSAINGFTTTRTDWAPTGANLSNREVRARISGVQVYRIGAQPNEGGEPSLPWAFPRNGGTGFKDVAQDQHGGSWIIWSRGQAGGGAMFPELGVGPGDNGSQTTTDNDVLAFLGRLGRKTPFGTDQAGSDTDIAGGYPTGSGTPGKIRFITPAAAGSSGTTVNRGVTTVEIELGRLKPYSVAHANLGTMAAPAILYCSDCTAASAPCSSGGAGAYAFRVAGGTWACPF